ncbi:MAG: AMP-binding protein [Spirochaetota bacterium]|nr:AMP-binding protein [Spirochaetota bacterium]
MLVNKLFEETVNRIPDKTALIFQDRRFTYKQINEEANMLAHALIDAGLQKGDRVVIFLDNCHEAIIAIYGVLKAGGIFSTLSATLKADKLKNIINSLETSFVISEWKKYKILSGVVDNVDLLKPVIICADVKSKPEYNKEKFIEWHEFIDPQKKTNPEISRIDLDLANIIFTSGSTGTPYGVMMTHRNIVSASLSIIKYLNNTQDDIILNVLPISFDYGLYQIIMTFIFGGTIVLEKSFSYPYVIIDKIIKERVTGFPAVPTIFAILLTLKDLKKKDFQHLRYLTNTGAALPVNHIKKLREIFPYVQIYSMYGLTECKRVSFLPPEEIDKRPLSVGKGMPNEEVFIVDENGQRVNNGVVGELVVRGSNVMKGYWKLPEETDRVLKPGLYPNERVLYTGDLFKMDEEGYLYFVARKDDLIKTRGERVSPKEVEDVLNNINGVHEAAVIGVADEILGSAIKAFIVSNNDYNLTEKDIIKACSNNLESFMVPKYVEFISSFRKKDSGKIDKMELK